MKPLFEVNNGKIAFANSIEQDFCDYIIDKTKNLLKTATVSSFFIDYILDWKDKKVDVSVFEGLWMLFMLGLSLYVYLDQTDEHADYFIDGIMAELDQETDDKAINSIQKAIRDVKELRVNEISVSRRNVLKKNYADYQERVSRLYDFINIFKRDLKGIEIDKIEDKNYYACDLIMDYSEYKINVEFESTGIKKLIKLYEYFNEMASGNIVFIDELDSNLHDVYLCALLEYLMEHGEGQLCFTTHNIGPKRKMRDPIKNITILQKQLNELQLENQLLKNILDRSGISYVQELKLLKEPEFTESFDPDQGARIRHPREITEKMVKVFLTYFWGRPDVYAKRSEKKSGEAGYYPQCNNFWQEVCPRKHGMKISCKDCSYRSDKKLTKSDILMHLQGRSYNSSDVVGVYPLFLNGTCRFLVFDFDNHEKDAEKHDYANTDDSWIEEVEAMRTICTLNGIDPLVERSRSGRGAHIWIFFDSPIPAALVRRFGFALLEKGAEQVNLKTFQFYDRMLPAQDMLPEGGIGNLIALPLQGKALRDGNSAFVDKNWNAYPNQWETLWSKPRLSKEFLELKIKEWTVSVSDFLSEHDEEGREKPWEKVQRFFATEVDGKMGITLSNGIYIDNLNLKPSLQNKIRRLAAFRNPVYYKNQKIGTTNFDTASWIYLGKDHLSGYIEIPRGLYGQLMDCISDGAIAYEVKDERQPGRMIQATFIDAGRTPVILSRYKDHSDKLYERIKNYADYAFLMTGNNSKREHKQILEQMKRVDRQESLVLVATGKLIGEGFDFPRLDTLIMATPVSFRGVVEQYAGRLNRDYEGKKNVIVYDYVDSHIPMFDNMYAKRLKAYKQIGYDVCSGIRGEKQSADAIFDSETYYPVYTRDLLEAKQNIVISSPVISGPKVHELIRSLQELQETGVQVTIITWEPDAYGFGDPAYWMQLHEDMRQAGFYMRYVEENCEHFAIVDQEIVWYGNMNLLGKISTEDSMMRVPSRKIAAELMEMAF